MHLALRQFPKEARDELVRREYAYPGGRNPETCGCILSDLAMITGASDGNGTFLRLGESYVKMRLEQVHGDDWWRGKGTKSILESANRVADINDAGELRTPEDVRRLLGRRN